MTVCTMLRNMTIPPPNSAKAFDYNKVRFMLPIGLFKKTKKKNYTSLLVSNACLHSFTLLLNLTWNRFNSKSKFWELYARLPSLWKCDHIDIRKRSQQLRKGNGQAQNLDCIKESISLTVIYQWPYPNSTSYFFSSSWCGSYTNCKLLIAAVSGLKSLTTWQKQFK